jgi:hypothetical protein
VRRSPEAVAVVFEERQLSSAQLNSRANQLTHHLKEMGVKPDMRAATCVERSLGMVIGRENPAGQFSQLRSDAGEHQRHPGCRGRCWKCRVELLRNSSRVPWPRFVTSQRASIVPPSAYRARKDAVSNESQRTVIKVGEPIDASLVANCSAQGLTLVRLVRTGGVRRRGGRPPQPAPDCTRGRPCLNAWPVQTGSAASHSSNRIRMNTGTSQRGFTASPEELPC